LGKRVLVLIIIVIYLRNEKVECEKDVVKKGHFWVLTTTWIEKDQIRRKAEEESTEHKKQELRDFMARKIA
jgi:hypothetical protein